MKLFKNKKNKALVAAVTMSLVMGVCGNALANLYNNGKTGFAWDPNQAGQSLSNGSLSRNVYPSYVGDVYGGYSGGTADVHDNHITLESILSGDLYVGYTNNGNVYNNSFSIARTTSTNTPESHLNNIYGGYANNGVATGNAVILNYEYRKVTANGYVVGGRSGGNNNNAAENNVELKEFTIRGGVIGGWAAANATGSGNAEGNKVNISNVDITGENSENKILQIMGGRSDSKHAINNTVNITNGNLGANAEKTEIYGGYAANTDSAVKATASGNSLIVDGPNIKGDVYGGRGYIAGGETAAEGNKVELGDSGPYDGSRPVPPVTTINGDVYGGYGVAKAANNIVNLKNNFYVGSNVIGGKAEQDAIENKVVAKDCVLIYDFLIHPLLVKPRIKDVNINKSVYGGWADNGVAQGNSVVLRGGSGTYSKVSHCLIVKDNIYGGKSNKGAANSNSVELSGTTKASKDVYGGRSENGSANSNSVTLNNNAVVNGYVYSGNSGKGSANNNTAVMKGSAKVNNNLYGGYGVTSADNNKAELNDKTVVSGNVYGGNSGNGSANSNSVVLNGNGKAAKDVYGGWADNGSANSNSITLNNNAVVNGNALSGKSDEGSADYNTIVMNNNAKVNNNLYGGDGSTGAENNKAELNDKAVVSGNVYGGISGNGAASSNSVVLNGSAKVNKDVYGGLGGTIANNNSVELKGKSSTERVLVQGNVFGGKAGTETGNLVYLNGYATVVGSVYGGASHAEGNKLSVEGMDNVINANIRNFENINIAAGGSLTVGGKSGNLELKGTLNNKGALTLLGDGNIIQDVKGDGTFNVEQGKTTVNGAFKQKAVNFTLPKSIEEDAAMLNLKGATADISLKDTDINTNIDNYTHGTTVTLLSSVNPITVAEEKLKINNEVAKETTIETAVDGLSGAAGAIVGYHVTDKSIKLTTNSYKLLQDTEVTKNVTLNNELNLNEQTLNMQSDPEGMDPYNTLTVNKLSGNGNLAIDVDFSGGIENIKNDKIIVSDDNAATINLNSIIVRGDLQGYEAGKDQNVENKVIVIDGQVNDNSLSVANDAIKTSTTDYIYTFTKGAAGKLNVTQEDAATIVDFIQGREKYNDDKILAYTLTKNVKVDEALGETKRDNSRELTVAFNKGVSLSGRTESGELVDGVTVADGYTLKLQGEDEATPGTMTQFKTVATVKEKGTLEVADMKFVDNGKDIVNKGTLKLSGTNTVNDITNDGGTTGTVKVEAGETTVSGALTQDTVAVNGGKLALKDATVGRLNVETDAALEVGGNLTISEGVFNNFGTVSLKSNNIITAITGPGTLKVEAEKVAVNSILTQNAVEVKAGSELELNCGTNIGGTLTNAGTVSLNGENSIVGAMNNPGTVILSGTNNIASAIGNGTFNVEKGKTTVSGAFAQKVVNVSDSELELQAPEKSFLSGEVQGHAANITGGKVIGHVYGGLSVEAAHENNVNITNGTVEGDVYGGVSYNEDAYKNTVNISDGNIAGDVYGALTINNGTAYKNTVNITGGTIEGNVYGGINNYGTNSTHHDNVINISGGEVKGTIYGASDKVEANNLLHVTGSNVKVGNVAYVQKLQFTLPAGYTNKDYKNALLELTNTADEDKEAKKTSLNFKGEGSIVVSSAPEERLTKDDVVTLIHKTNDKALEINENGKFIFDENGVLTKDYQRVAQYFITPFNVLKGNMQLVSLDDDNIRNDLLFQVGNHILDDDDEKVKPIVPIDSKDDPVPEPDPEPQPQPKPEPKPEPKPDDPEPVKPDQKPIVPPDGDDKPAPIIPVDPEPQPDPTPDPKPDPDPDPTPDPDPDPKPDPTPTPKPVAPDPKPTPEPEPDPINYEQVYNEFLDNVKTAMETRANGAALLNEAGDFLMKQGLSNAKMAGEQSKAEGESSMAPFVALGGGKLRYETGSHVDSKSWHGAVGLAKQVNGLTFGVAIQQGKSNYDAYVNKAHSEGTSKSVGGALFAEKKITNGLHFDAAVRAGRVKNDYNANVTYSFEGAEIYNVRFKESSAFYGISFGGGKEFNLKNKDKVDVYGRYAWTHTGSSKATTNWQDELKFDGINSHRILLGSRYTHSVNERNELYAGLGWQYELGGKVKGSVYGYSAPEPSLKGSSGLLELGWKAAAEENLTVDLNLSGWTGKQRGVMAGVNMQWKF